MAQVRAVRRPYTSERRGRVNDASRASTGVERGITPQAPRTLQPQHVQAPPGVTTVTLPALEDPGSEALPEASNEEREAPGTGEEMEGLEAIPDGTEYVLESNPDETESAVEAPAVGVAAVESTQDAPVQSTVDYSSWTLVKLAAELKRRELPSSGSKAELVARLLESDVDAGA